MYSVIILMAKNKLINLLPQEEFDSSIMGRALAWAMSSFRIIVIVTEMIVMAAFLSRFWLDAQNSDLDDSIKVATAQISSQSDFEKEFRGVQSKLAIFKQITSQESSSNQLALISSTVPQNLTFSGINVQDNSIQIKGAASSELDIAQFISNLKAQTAFKSVDLESVSTSDQNQSSLNFLINVNY